MRARVLSFNRLAYSVFKETGGSGKALLDDAGKNMLLRKALNDVRGELAFFMGAADKQGFIDKLCRTVTEFYQYGITPEMLLPPEGSSGGVGGKLHDLHVIFKKYVEYKERDYISADETLDVLSYKINESESLIGADIWIDGFNGFTEQEYKVIGALAQKAGSMTFSLCHDGGSEFFAGTKATLDRLSALTPGNGQTLRAAGNITVLDGGKRFRKSPEMAYLEYSFDRAAAAPYRRGAAGIETAEAENMYREINRAAVRITDLLRNGYRCSEIGVIACDFEKYSKGIKAVFGEFGIPVHIDSNTDILSHPLVEFIRAALAVCRNDMQYESVFRLLKTGLTKMARDDIDLLENYVLAYGVRGGMWRKPWVYGFSRKDGEFDGERMNGLRCLVNGIVEPLYGEVRGKGKGRRSVREYCEAVYGFLIKNGIGELTAEKGGEHGFIRVWEKIIHIFDKMVEIMGNETVTPADFAGIAEAGFAGSNLGNIPPSLDQAVAGDLARTILPDIRALFVLGANEGDLPRRTGEASVLSDEDRGFMTSAMKLKVAPDSTSLLRENQFAVYTALTKPKEFLSVSYYSGDLDGKAKKPSAAVERIRRLFPEAARKRAGQLDFGLEDISGAAPVFGSFSGVLRGSAESGELSGIQKDVYAYFLTDHRYIDKIKKLEDILRNAGRERKLSGETVGALYRGRVRTSVSKIEQYARCPFSYFAAYNLKARERRIYEVENVDVGNVFHGILNSFALKLKERDIPLGGVGGEELYGLAEEAVDGVLGGDEYEIYRSSAQYAYFAERVKAIAKRSIWALCEHMKDSGFELAYTEVGFTGESNGGNDFGAISLELGDAGTMELEGRIDRVDMLNLDGDRYVKVIDYKSGNKSFSFPEVYYGLQMQLTVYLNAFIWKYTEKYGAERTGRILPGALLYFTLADPFINFSGNTEDPEQFDRELLKSFRMSGVVLGERDIIGETDGIGAKPLSISGEGFDMLMGYVMEKTKGMGREILNGNIGIKPYKFKGDTGCAFCAYRPICRFDPASSGEEYGSLKPMGREEAMEKIMGG